MPVVNRQHGKIFQSLTRKRPFSSAMQNAAIFHIRPLCWIHRFRDMDRQVTTHTVIMKEKLGRDHRVEMMKAGRAMLILRFDKFMLSSNFQCCCDIMNVPTAALDRYSLSLPRDNNNSFVTSLRLCIYTYFKFRCCQCKSA
jgi:hypothetical protein